MRQTRGMSDSSPTNEPVTVTVSDAVATVTLNRPEGMNGLDNATKDALLAAVTRVAQDDTVRAVVLTGSGRAFCVGQDLKEHRTALSEGGELGDTVTNHYNPTVHALATMDKPVIAAINGVAAGAGVSLALACDFRVIVDSAGLNLAFAGIGLSCDTGASWTLPRLVGTAKAIELLYFPRTIPAQEALDLGLVTRVVSADEFGGVVADLAAQLASGPTRSYGAIRRSVANSAGTDLADALAFEAQMMNETGLTQDHRDAVEAFVAKQPPVWRGR